MQAINQSPLLAESPSFNSYSSTRLAEIAAKVIEEFSVDQESSTARYRNDDELPKPLEISNDKSPQHEDADNEDDEDDEDDDDDFEFAVVGRDPVSSPISADEIFSNGQIRPVFPVFNRDLLFADAHDEDSKPDKKTPPLRVPLGKLMLEERDRDNAPSSSSSEADELESIPTGTYCVWKPKSVEASPDRCKKSNSTGSSKPWKFRDLLPRSNSDGKDAYVFLSPSKTMKKINDKTEKAANRTTVQKSDKQQQQHPPKERRNSISNPEYNSAQAKVAAKGKVKAKGVSGDTVSAHEIHYVRNRALKEEDRRRSYLPYRQDLVGLFSNVNGLSRSLHPF